MKKIGILKEPNNDPRVCILPETVEELNKKGIEVLFESHAGAGLGIPNIDYQKAGGISTSAYKIFEEADLVCSINHKYNYETLTSEANFVGIFNPLNRPQELRRYTEWTSVYSLDLLPRTSLAQSMDVLSSTASLAGYKAVVLAANHLGYNMPMFTTAAGTLRPAKVLILGAGVAGLQAIATAKRLGAIVHAFDLRKSAGEAVKSLGATFIEVEGAIESSRSGGYAISQSEDFEQMQLQMIHEAALDSDIIITSANIPGQKAPVLIREKTIMEMKKGSVIVDLASEQGGNCHRSVNNKTIQFNGVTIIGDSKLASTLPFASSKMLSNNYLSFIQMYLKDKNHELIQAIKIIDRGEKIHPLLCDSKFQKFKA